MVRLVIVDKKGDVSSKSVKKLKVTELYKKCGFRKSTDFGPRHCWKLSNEVYISLFAKSSGRANTENKFELPPPIDSQLYFGSMAIVKSSEQIFSNDTLEIDDDCEDVIEDIDENQWAAVYEKLMGGFEDLNTSGEYESDELDNYSTDELTKTGGYLKDGFVVSEEDEDEDEEGEYTGTEEQEYSDDNLDDDTSEQDEEEVSYGSEDEESEVETTTNAEHDYDSEGTYSYEDEEEYGSELEEEDYLSE